MIESHPDNALEDLRLDEPFAELKDHVKSYDLDNMGKKVCALFSSDCLEYLLKTGLYFYICFWVFLFFFLQDHSHTPWIIIVAKYLEKWLSEVLFLGSSYRISDKYVYTALFLVRCVMIYNSFFFKL